MNDKQKRLILVLGGIIVLGILLIIVSILRSNKKSTLPGAQSPYPAGRVIPSLVIKPTTAANAALAQILELTFSYDAEKKQLAVTKKEQTNGVAHATPDRTLPYELWEVDATNTIIFDTYFSVATALFVDSPYNRTGIQQLPHSDTTVAVPYVPNAQTIIVTKNNTRVLTFPIK